MLMSLQDNILFGTPFDKQRYDKGTSATVTLLYMTDRGYT
jgi:hypothetical protein